MCECEYSDVRVIGYVRVEMCECEWRCASSTFVLVTSFHLVSKSWNMRGLIFVSVKVEVKNRFSLAILAERASCYSWAKCYLVTCRLSVGSLVPVSLWLDYGPAGFNTSNCPNCTTQYGYWYRYVKVPWLVYACISLCSSLCGLLSINN